jgi:hypothetical protein
VAGSTVAPWRRRTRNVCAGDACGGDWGDPDLTLRMEFLTVGEAHQVAVPCGLKIQAPELDFESGREGVRAAHGVTLTTVLGANHHRENW